MAPYSKQHEDHNFRRHDINFFNIFDLQYQPGASTIDFYNQYRSLVVANLKRRGDIIIWQNSKVLEEDEKLSPTFEDMILASVLGLINFQLLEHVRDNYHHLIGRGKCLMDYKSDILDLVPLFLSKKDDSPSAELTGSWDDPERYQSSNLIEENITY